MSVDRRRNVGGVSDVHCLSTSIRLSIFQDGSTIYRGHNHNINITGRLKRASLICVLHNLGSATLYIIYIMYYSKVR